MFDKIVSAKVEFSKEECYCGIQDFYDLLARKLGYDPEKVQYDCTKICVTKQTRNQIYSFYENEQQKTKGWIIQNWLMYGPKANLPQDAYIAKVQKGFIVEG